MHGHCHSHEGKWAAGRRRQWQFGGGSGGRHGGRFGEGGEDLMRARRMLAQGDLRLVALALITEAPRHGYEIIKLLEENLGLVLAQPRHRLSAPSPIWRRPAT